MAFKSNFTWSCLSTGLSCNHWQSHHHALLFGCCPHPFHMHLVTIGLFLSSSSNTFVVPFLCLPMFPLKVWGGLDTGGGATWSYSRVCGHSTTPGNCLLPGLSVMDGSLVTSPLLNREKLHSSRGKVSYWTLSTSVVTCSTNLRRYPVMANYVRTTTATRLEAWQRNQDHHFIQTNQGTLCKAPPPHLHK